MFYRNKQRLYLAYYYEDNVFHTALLLVANGRYNRFRFDVDVDDDGSWQQRHAIFTCAQNLAALVFLGKVSSKFCPWDIYNVLATVPSPTDAEVSTGRKNWTLAASQVPASSPELPRLIKTFLLLIFLLAPSILRACLFFLVSASYAVWCYQDYPAGNSL
jgi:hypothetical protein